MSRYTDNTPALRTEYAALRAEYLKMAPKCNFRRACEELLGQTENITPDRWVWAAELVVQGLAECQGEENAQYDEI
jgi:hypothetical protein